MGHKNWRWRLEGLSAIFDFLLLLSASLPCYPWILPLPFSRSCPYTSCFSQNAVIVTGNPLLICWTSLHEQTSLSCGKRSFTYANQVNESRTVKGFIPEAFAYLALEIFECSAPSCATRTQKPWQYVFSGDYVRRQLPSRFATATIWGIGSFEHRGYLCNIRFCTRLLRGS